jgi:hypothetical protein
MKSHGALFVSSVLREIPMPDAHEVFKTLNCYNFYNFGMFLKRHEMTNDFYEMAIRLKP